MQLVEQHVISRRDPRYALIDEAAFKSKNLYNAALYEMRQAFIHHRKYLSYEEMDKHMQSHEAYKALPAKVSQQVLRHLTDAWKAFREAKAAYEGDPSRFFGCPRLPKYKHKTEGRNLLIYTIQAISRGKKGLQRGIIKPSMLAITVKTQHKEVDQVRIVPRIGFYVVEVVYEQEPYAFHGKRIKRGLYQASDGRLVNADWNGAANIIRKVAPNAFGSEGVEGGEEMLASLVVHPVRIVVPLTKPKTTVYSGSVRLR